MKQLTKFSALLSLMTLACHAVPAGNAASGLTQSDKGAPAVIRAAQGVINRVTDGKVHDLRMELIPTEQQRDVYEYSAKNGVLTVRGSSPVALCRGFYDYAKANGMGMVTWVDGCHLRIPQRWPDAAETRQVTPFQWRHSHNVVTFGYTTVYWTWERWQRELDWQAMHGFNMLMAPIATEAIMERVWQKVGLTQAEIDADTPGPAYAPWYRMGNLRKHGGPMPNGWHADQVALQHKILKRMRDLDMEPVVQGFAGFVPQGYARVHPETKLTTMPWSNMPKETRRFIMSPVDPQFAVLTKMYMDSWKKEFGNARYFLVDTFNEMSPPMNVDLNEFFSDYGACTWKAIHNADPNAVWVLQGWCFFHQKKLWNADRVTALLRTVPDDQVLVLDYVVDEGTWKRYCGERGAFGGKNWMIGYVPNMGGHTQYTGNLGQLATLPSEVLKDPRAKQVTGITIEGEGLENNEVIYELICDTAWRRSPVDLKKWIPNYCRNRYGSYPPAMAKAWDSLRRIYSRTGVSNAHRTFSWQRSRWNQKLLDTPVFYAATKDFLAAAPQLRNSELYRADALEMTALALGCKVDDWVRLAKRAYGHGDVEVFNKAADRSLEILEQIDRLLEAHPYHRLEPWLNFARTHGDTPELKDYYESDARSLITYWSVCLNNYACRVWSGLIRDYYREMLRREYEAMRNKAKFDAPAFMLAYTKQHGVSTFKPCEEPLADAQAWFEQAMNEQYPKVSVPLPEWVKDEDVVGEWMPFQLDTEWKMIEWPFPPDQLGTAQGVVFWYTSGRHRLEIKSVKLVVDNNVVAMDEHVGYAGTPSLKNSYQLKIPADTQGNNACVLRVVVRGGGGTDSCGSILLQR